MTVVDDLKQLAINSPDDIAIVSRDGLMTYEQLYNLSLSLASHIREQVAVAESSIAIMVEPCNELQVAVWGVLLSGNSYLPIDPEYPDERIKYILSKSESKLLLTNKNCWDKAEKISKGFDDVTVEDVDFFIDSYEEGKCVEPARSITGKMAAYNIFTSGSTGRPKGVTIEHGALFNQLRWLSQEFQLGSSSTIIYKTPYSFDAAQWEILMVSQGCKIVMGQPGANKDPSALIDDIVNFDVTALQCVPTLLKALLKKPAFKLCDSLKIVFCGGESLSKELAGKFLSNLPGKAIVNLYGPTETTINASYLCVTPQILEQYSEYSTVPIGKPVPNTEFYILGNDKEPLPQGEQGELYIGGVQLARGYLNDWEKTENSFLRVTNIMGKELRLYKTGDKAILHRDGNYSCLGRLDDQVKINGFRVELSEIDGKIEEHDWVERSVTTLVSDSRTKAKKLVTGVVLDSEFARIMDQNHISSHHLSKANKFQVKAQLSRLGRRLDLVHKPKVDLSFKESPSWLESIVFERKTYRFFNGGDISIDDIVAAASHSFSNAAMPLCPCSLDFDSFSLLLRGLGEFKSNERLLPKLGYASPGALNSLRFYVEANGQTFVRDGLYYYDPLEHNLYWISDSCLLSETGVAIYSEGHIPAITSVYTENALEVIEIEWGHALGLIEFISNRLGLSIEVIGKLRDKPRFETVEEDNKFLGGIIVGGSKAHSRIFLSEVSTFIHLFETIEGKPSGTYLLEDGSLKFLSHEVIRKRDVIAINQDVYERASFGVSFVSNAEGGENAYVQLGLELQRMQHNNLNVGLMSSGYSSKTGDDLPSAKRIRSIISQSLHDSAASYFAVGGRVSNEQRYSKGMNEDKVHASGPAEKLKVYLSEHLPRYMVPSEVIPKSKFPTLPSGKLDLKRAKSEIESSASVLGEIIHPRGNLQEKIASVFKSALELEEVSVDDDFFQLGGNSLQSVELISRVNEIFGTQIGIDKIFEYPTVLGIAELVTKGYCGEDSRIVNLKKASLGEVASVYCWPGLGGYPFNLRDLANLFDNSTVVYGIQALGIRKKEAPPTSFDDLVDNDYKIVSSSIAGKKVSLLGYSFGAKVALAMCKKLEKAGYQVERLFLIAPGAPEADKKLHETPVRLDFSNRYYLSLMFSVFFRTTHGVLHDACMRTVYSRKDFIEFVEKYSPSLPLEVIEGIVEVVESSYDADYKIEGNVLGPVSADVVVVKAKGDDYTSIDAWLLKTNSRYVMHESNFGHFDLLTKEGVGSLAQIFRMEGEVENA